MKSQRQGTKQEGKFLIDSIRDHSKFGDNKAVYINGIIFDTQIFTFMTFLL